jgi:threonine/homoserine/homoserine lactone efflux protein
MTTFVFMAVTIAAWVFCIALALFDHAHHGGAPFEPIPKMSGALQKLAGVCLIGFGLKLAIGKCKRFNRKSNE